MTMKYNPFRPNNIVHPGMFVGRGTELERTDRCLLQTKNGNPHHFLILGERGIGKTSLLLAIDSAGQGGFATGGAKFNFLTLSLDLNGCTSPTDVVRKIGRSFRAEMAEHRELLDGAKKFYDWLLGWEVLGVKFNKRSVELDPEEITEQLVVKIANFTESQSRFDGILILIDEADGPPVEADLGRLLKMISERLSRRGCNKLVFGLAGLPGAFAKLKESHESSPRLFEIMNLQPLSDLECQLAVQRGLEDANEKNPHRTAISAEALALLADLSEGYPHFVQQFAFCAFEEDDDNNIDVDDVFAGANEALQQLGDKFFNEMYHARISSDDYRKVLDTMANYGDDWVERKTIISDTSVAEHNISNALRSLTQRTIIHHDEKRRGFYRLPTRSFAAWIRANRVADLPVEDGS